MDSTSRSPRADALAIFQAGLAAADARDAVHRALRLEGDALLVGGTRVALQLSTRIVSGVDG